MSRLPDATGADEGRGKGGTPKDRITCKSVSWAYGEEPYDCHLHTDEALSGQRSQHIYFCYRFLEGRLRTPLFSFVFRPEHKTT